MDLKRYLPGNDEDKKVEYLWALIIEPNFVQAGIWRISGNTAQIVYSSNPTLWETDNDLVTAVDTALSAAIHDFPEELNEPNKTVFGVIASWVSEGQIKEEHLDKIKKICNEMSLKPAGFVVLSEAIAHYLKTEEGSPLNSILLGVYEDKLEMALFKLGNLAGSTQVARSVSLVEDVVEGLTRFGSTGAFPSRFILYNGKEKQLEDAQQDLIKASWEDYQTVKFLHPPKIEALSSDNKLDAVSLAGAAEMGEVEKVERVKLVGGPTGEPSAKINQFNDQVNDVDLVGTPAESQLSDTATPEELGFTVGEGAENLQSEEVELEETRFTQQGPQINYLQSVEEIENVVEVDESEFVSSSEGESSVRENSTRLKNPFSGLNLSPGILSKPFKKFGGVLHLDSQFKKIFIAGIISLVLLFGVGFALWWYLPKATVTIYLAAQQQNERVDIYISADDSDLNTQGRTLPGQVISTTVEGDRTISTTGTKLVGDRATGEVKLFRVGTQLTLDAGTTIRGPNSLNFTLEEDVVVASGSASNPGNTTARVTADAIGAEYNLASGTSFTVGNFSDSDIEAVNESDFFGGTSREVNAVSERDMTNLENELSDELTQKALEELRGKLDEGQFLVEESIEETIEGTNFSAEEGDEAETLRLSMSKTVEIYSVSETQLIEIAKEVLVDKVPDGYVLRDENIDVDFVLDEEDEGVYKFDTRITANLLPQADPEAIKQNIKGKYPAVAQEYLNSNIPGFVRAEVEIDPSLPGRLNTLPRMEKNIEIQISAER